MAQIRFLDGKYAATTTLVDDHLLTAGDGRYMFEERNISSGSRPGTPYFLKSVDYAQWADPNLPEWTAALDDDPAEDD